MAMLRIESYALLWQPSSGKGGVKLKLDNGQTLTHDVNESNFLALAAILREQNVYFDDEKRAFQTSLAEPDSP